jgi:hypothetical protein
MSCTIPEAIKVLVSAPNLDHDQIAALQAKLDVEKAKRLIQTIIKKTKDASTQFFEKQIKAHIVFELIWNTVKGWETAWRLLSRTVTIRNLSAAQRNFRFYKHTAFDIRDLTDEEHDLIFLLAYARINPLSRVQFDEVYKNCSECTKTGRVIRNLLQSRIDKDQVLSEVFPPQDLVIGKRKRDPAEPEPAFPKDREKGDCQ